MLHIIYAANSTDVQTEWIGLNGRNGAVNLFDSDDDLDITFEDLTTAREWIAAISASLDELANT